MSKDIEVILRDLDFVTAALIFTGQITIGGVFIQTESSFALSFSGPITGISRVESKPRRPIVDASLDIVHFLVALLLISDRVNVVGTFIASGRFTIVVGGPPFGGDKRQASDVERMVYDFKEYLQKDN
ncbi:hypothetical protein [Texcoconibacillus texcoconensis]|uniref:Uncharacterized protein n=1 Tax=Texcoconibacillus texcoconensis TaxID=1095777 RepID=A0A840QV07_9BACI|nr:hypothetical protein [Texcoconibacillus texcoconensis]MBB5175101.1 hypothetical protein [Texcoconibacillus texcoconensis]